MFSRVFGILFAILLLYFEFSVGLRTWNYELLSAKLTSSDETKLNGSMWVERVARGGSVFSGTLDWNFDTDNETEGYLILYHSQSGRNDDFSETPYRLKNMKFTDGVNSGVYNEMFYKNLHDCSNLEKIEQGFVPPFPRKIYEFRQCVPSTNGFPDVLPLGYYKIVVGFRGQVDIVITFIIKLKPKL